MFNLPNEILNLIFTLLVQQDKLECMTVCQRWHDVIYHQSLFITIFIDHQQQLDKLMEKVENNYILGTKVESLILGLNLDPDYNTNILVERFPNLRQFYLVNKSTFIYDNEIRLQQSHPWCKHIESVVELNSEIITKSLLHSGLCKKLTYISVDGRSEQYGNRLFNALENAPTLRKLCLKRYIVSFHDLEMLHEKAPLLDSLSLQNVESMSDSIPLNIRPATSMKSFRCMMSYFDSSEVRNPQMDYINEKYTHLEELVLQLEHLNYSDDDYDESDDDQRPVISLTQQQERFFYYLKTLGSRLKTLSLAVEGFGDCFLLGGFDFYFIDQCGCQIKNLNLYDITKVENLQVLAITTQARYIQSLSLTQIEDLNSLYISTEWLKSFTMLKDLHLCSCIFIGEQDRQILNLTNLLENLSGTRLETLELNSLILQFNDSSINEIYPSLKELSFLYIDFETGTDAFISRVFPNLKRLKMNNCFKDGDSFILPNTYLSYLEIRNHYSDGASPIMVITLDNSQTRLYNATKKSIIAGFAPDDVGEDLSTFSTVYSQPFNTSTTVPKLTIVCKSVFHFFMTNYDVISH